MGHEIDLANEIGRLQGGGRRGLMVPQKLAIEASLSSHHWPSHLRHFDVSQKNGRATGLFGFAFARLALDDAWICIPKGPHMHCQLGYLPVTGGSESPAVWNERVASGIEYFKIV